jgi:septum formation protein
MPDTDRPALVLASSSRYRRELLERLRLPFSVERPEIDETAREGEAAEATARRLARQKAESVAAHHHNALVIGSDQVASWRGEQIGKPGNHEKALAQLEQFQGESVQFYSALCVVDTATRTRLEDCATVRVRFRKLASSELDAYLRSEQPYDCAGSAKAEGLGIALMEEIDSDDPTALIGLPLIRLVSILSRLGYRLFDRPRPGLAP